MKKYRNLYYHSKWGDGHIVDNLIALGTQSYNLWRMFGPPMLWDVVKLGLSHQEIWRPNSHGNFTWESTFMYPDGPLQFGGSAGTCYTSTRGQAGGKSRTGWGTCKRDAGQVLKHLERWSYVEHEVSDDAFEDMIEFLDDEVYNNAGYGLGPDKNICSELVHNANVVSGEFAGPFRIVTPLGDALREVKSGLKLIPLSMGV